LLKFMTPFTALFVVYEVYVLNICDFE